MVDRNRVVVGMSVWVDEGRGAPWVGIVETIDDASDMVFVRPLDGSAWLWCLVEEVESALV